MGDTDSYLNFQNTYYRQWLLLHEALNPDSLQSLAYGFQAFWNKKEDAEKAYQILLKVKTEDN